MRIRCSVFSVSAVAFLMVTAVLPSRSFAFNHPAAAATPQDNGQAAQPALTGKWDLNVTTSDGPQKASADLTVADDGTVSGTIDSQYGHSSISSGSLTGTQFTIKFSINVDGNPTDVSMSGTIDGDSIKGNGSAGDSTFDFTGVRAAAGSME
ncbi:MAG TPA: hypothetical protein VN862_04290 [Candidatus Acidoferrales bacterium]|nr:hypothetical protein [Candidatus Acidoferrales bacterium]